MSQSYFFSKICLIIYLFMQSKIQKEAFRFFKTMLYKAYNKRRYLKYQFQFPSLRQSQIQQKILREWDTQKVDNIFTIFRLIRKQDPDLLLNLKQTQTHWPYLHLWKKNAYSKLIAPKGFDLNDYQSQNELPANDIQNWDRQIKQKEYTHIQEKILVYDLIQNILESQMKTKQFSSKAYDFEKKAFNQLMKNNRDINQAEFCDQVNICKKIDIQISSQIQKEQKKKFKLIAPTVRIFEHKTSTIMKDMDDEYEQIIEQRQEERQRKYKNPKPFKKQFQQIEKCQKAQFKKKRYRNRLKKLIKKGKTIIQKNFIRHYGKKYHYCQKCDKCIRFNSKHKCKRIQIPLDQQKKHKPWFLPAFSAGKKLFGFCLRCRNYGQSHKHPQQCPFQTFSLFPKQMQFKVQGELSFDEVDLLSQHFTSPHIKSDEVNFYQKGNIGFIPQMIQSNERITLNSNQILTSVKQIPQNKIFGPIALDALPYQFNNRLPWQTEYFSHNVKLGKVTFVLCPLYRMNGLAFIVNKPNAQTLPNVEVFVGAHNMKIKLFAKTIREIHPGEEIVISNIEE